MKILYLCPDAGVPVLGRKGAAVHVRELVAAFHRAGHEVVLVAHALTKSPWEQPAIVEANVLQLQPASRVAEVSEALKQFNVTLSVENTLPGEVRRILQNQELEEKLRRRFEVAPPDFIYERASIYATAGALLARTLNVPHLVELNAPLAMEQASYRGTGLGELAAQAERWTLTQADAVLAVSAAVRDHALGLGVEAARVQVSPNGINPTFFQPGPRDAAIRARWGLDDGPLLGFVGGLRPWHGVEVLPELLERLARRHEKVQFLIVGEGQLRPQLEERFRKIKSGGRAIFTGALPHEQVAPVIRQFDVALAPYPKLDHAFYFSPLKLFEYMACGVPVAAAGIGQIAEVVRNDRTGLLFPPGDVDALEQACHRLIESPRLGRNLGRAAAKLVHTHYTWDQNADRAVELARAIIAERQAEPGENRLQSAASGDAGGFPEAS